MSIKIGWGPDSLSIIACIGVVYSEMCHLKCKCSSKQECLSFNVKVTPSRSKAKHKDA